MKKKHLAGLGALAVALSVSAFAQQAPYEADIQRGAPAPLPAGAAVDCATVADNPFTNCGFESGDFTGWVLTDITNPFFDAVVDTAGVTPGFGFFASAPTQGTFAALSGFDGAGPGAIEFAQDVSLPTGADTLTFDYRAAYQLTFGATVDREFRVEVQPSGGGAALASEVLLVAMAGDTVTDTGALVGAVDVSAFAGQAVRVAFVLDVPENFTGPAFFQLDNVSLDIVAEPQVIPTLSSAGLVSAALLLLLLGGVALRHRAE